MEQKIALSMIVKGSGKEPENLRRALQSAAPHVDAIYITTNGSEEETAAITPVLNEFNVHASHVDANYIAEQEMIDWLQDFFGWEPFTKVGDKIFQFDVARNFSLSQVPKDYEWIFWMDCDDVLLRGENLRSLIKSNPQTEAFYFNYIYQAELEENRIKNILIQHQRERLVRNADLFHWVMPIHETLIEKRPTEKTLSDAVEILHLSEDGDRKLSLQRNLKNLEFAIYKTKGKDPRQVYYLAKALFDLNTPEHDKRAEGLIYKGYLYGENPSGWPEERAQAWQYLAEIYRRRGEHNNSVKAAMNALIEHPDDPAIFINIATSEMLKKNWERAIFWVKLAASVPQKQTTLVTNPKDLQSRTMEVLYHCCLNLNMVDEAWAAITKLVEMFPGDQQVYQAAQFMAALRQQRDLLKDFIRFSNYLKKTGEHAKIKALLAATPEAIKDNPLVLDLYRKNNPPTPWGDKSIVIYCGPGFTPWSPKAMKNPGSSFVGGSEEAVILMSEALARKGWEVTVYADPGADEGTTSGVLWLPYYKFNREDHFNILIGWRDIRFFDGDFDAKKKYLWCHDIQNPLEFTPERVAKIDKVMFLSKWHRDNVPDLPEEKVFLTSNGIPEEQA